MYSPFQIREEEYDGAPPKSKDEQSSIASTEMLEEKNKNVLVAPTVVVPIVPSLSSIVTYSTRKNYKIGLACAMSSIVSWIFGIYLLSVPIGIAAQVFLWINYRHYKYDIFKSNRMDALKSRKIAIIHLVVISILTLLHIMIIGVAIIIGLTFRFPSQ